MTLANNVGDNYYSTNKYTQTHEHLVSLQWVSITKERWNTHTLRALYTPKVKYKTVKEVKVAMRKFYRIC